MKHPVSVSELLELHRLGELYLKWTATPFAISEEDLQELQEISDRYSINHSSALFSFQRKYQQDMAVHIEQKLDQALAAIPGLEKALAMVPTTPLLPEEQTGYIAPVEVQERREMTLDEIDQREKKLNDLLHRAAATGDPVKELDLLLEAKKVAPLPPGAWQRIQFLERHLDDAASAEEPQESPADREAQAQHRADQLRSFREQLDGEMTDERELEILRDLSNVDELTDVESRRMDELIRDKAVRKDAKTHQIPAGVLSEAISGSSEKGSK